MRSVIKFEYSEPIHHSPFTIDHSPLTIAHCPLPIDHCPLPIHPSQPGYEF
ncbi:hypothetical protein [Longitalea luteola]|uniref:hypothetical protein n=1 Tax=Longitalea luteola TaxID=2812563 RepID=UPI001A958D4B|nr:hypothetical protein [Longitalea luteola]